MRLLVLFAVAFVPALLARSAGSMAVSLAVAGAFLAPTLACVFVLTGARALPGTITETFAWLTSSFLVGSAAGSAAAGALSGGGSGAHGYGAAGLIVLAGALLWLVRRPAPIAVGATTP
jgi:predicted MFS family arabinose efflux permease